MESIIGNNKSIFCFCRYFFVLPTVFFILLFSSISYGTDLKPPSTDGGHYNNKIGSSSYGSSNVKRAGFVDGLSNDNYEYRAYNWFNLSSLPSTAVVGEVKIDLVSSSSYSNIYIQPNAPGITRSQWESASSANRFGYLKNNPVTNNYFSAISCSTYFNSSGVALINAYATKPVLVSITDKKSFVDKFLIDDSHWSIFSGFSILIKYAITPTLAKPIQNAQNVPMNQLFSWTDTKAGVNNLRYTLQISKNAAFTALVYNNKISGSSLTLPSGTLARSTQYWWRVNVTNPTTGYSTPWSTVWSFKTRSSATVMTAPPISECTAIIDENLMLHIPYLAYIDPISGVQTNFWADFIYEADPTLVVFKLVNYGIIDNSPILCSATISDNLNIHIPNVLFPNGLEMLSIDLENISNIFSDGYFYFILNNYDFVAN